MPNTQPDFSFIEACTIYEYRAGDLYREPDPERSVFHRGAWILHDETGLAAIVNQQDIVFAGLISGMLIQMAEGAAH